MFYILSYKYKPNTAGTNRFLGYLNALDKKGIPTTVVFLHPDRQYHRLAHTFQHIKVEYMWHRWLPYRNPFTSLTLNRYIQRFLHRLKEGDTVYSYSVNKLIHSVQKVKGVHTYAEITEHPKASPGWVHPLLKLSPEEYRETILKLDNLFVISRPLKDYYVEMGRAPESVTIVNMFVDPERFKHIQKKHVGAPYIAYCGTASISKDGVDDLIKAFSIVSQNHPELELYIIGKTPKKNDRIANKRLMEELEISDKIHFTGVVSADEMPQLLKNASILALARPNNLQAAYGFPTKLGEYLLSGNPVVVTDVGTISDYLEDQKSAMIARPDDPEDFAQKAAFLLEHPQQAKEIGHAGSVVANTQFNNFIETEKLIHVIGL